MTSYRINPATGQYEVVPDTPVDLSNMTPYGGSPNAYTDVNSWQATHPVLTDPSTGGYISGYQGDYNTGTNTSTGTDPNDPYGLGLNVSGTTGVDTSGWSPEMLAYYQTQQANEKYYNEMQTALQTRAQTLSEQQATIQNQLSWATDANTKQQLQQQLMQIQAQISQYQQTMQQNTDQFNQQQTLAVQQFQAGTSQFAQTYGLQQQQYQSGTSQWAAEFGASTSQYAQNLALQQQAQDWTQQYQGGQLGIQQAQTAQAQQNYLAQLAANPVNWLQYNAAAQQPTVAQPWMQTLGGATAGSVIAGQQWTQPNLSGSPANAPYSSSTAGQPTGATNYSNLPQLTQPSAQTYNLMPTSSQQQYQGYEQARTGLTPEDIQKQLWMRSAPTGQSTLAYR
jgi:hypothetical protein